LAKRNYYGKWTLRHPPLRGGGQAHTYLAFETGNEQAGDYVLKRLKNDNRIGRFRNEAKAGLLLRHPNIVDVVDGDLESPEPYIVTKHYPQGELTPKLIQGKTLVERLALFQRICEGVAYAHENGIIHRDLKPDNIFMADDGTPVVGDFGLCFIDVGGERFTLVDEAVGARWYMAPELGSGRVPAVLPACDVYSLGKLLYWILAGRIFDRERHREPDWDLNPAQADPDLALVYELLDMLITADPSQRQRRGRSVAQNVQHVVDRILKRRRMYELAGTSHCAQEHHHLRIANFRPGSIVTTRLVNPPGRAVLGFGVSGSTLAAWGRRRREQADGDNLEVMIVRAPANYNTVVAERSGTIWQTQGEGRFALAFSPSHDPVIAVVEKADSKASASLTVLNVNRNAQFTERLIGTDLDDPRNVALAVGPSGETAIYVAPQSSRREARPEVFFLKEDLIERVPLLQNTNFPGPLAFSREGRLHQANVVSTSAGGREMRSLIHRWREPAGGWHDEVVASARAGPMSAHIDLALTPDGLPVVLTDWDEEGGGRSLVCYVQRTGGWHAERLDLTSFLSEFGPLGIAAGGAKQLFIDSHGNKHITMYSDSGGSRNVLYMSFDSHFGLIERRVFPAQAFVGMGVDELDTVYLAVL
jgi:serine/threonine protein kinase